MLRRVGGMRRLAECACRRHARLCTGEEGFAAFAVGADNNFFKCSCGVNQVCMFHGSASLLANPDNKPAPPGKDPKDPSNTRHDGLDKDPDDSQDYAPGYYDGKEGGHRKVGSQEQSSQVADEKPDAAPKNWRPEEAEDPNPPKEDDSIKPDIPDMEGRGQNKSAVDAQNPPASERNSQVPQQAVRLSGRPEPKVPPQSTPNPAGQGDHEAAPGGVDRPGKKLADEGRVKPGEV